MTENEYCFLCGRNGQADRLEKHHIYGGPYRSLSEKYGLVVYLCGDSCHRNGKKAAHRCAATAHFLHTYGQKKAMQENGWSIEQFRAVFGKNYLEEGEDES